MPETFDPYYKWLGIPSKDQPPHHYRLLGLELFESDAEVIDTAANRQMAFVQSCADGPHLADSQRLLNEIAAARLCLLNASKKADYDRELRKKLERAAPAKVPAGGDSLVEPSRSDGALTRHVRSRPPAHRGESAPVAPPPVEATGPIVVMPALRGAAPVVAAAVPPVAPSAGGALPVSVGPVVAPSAARHRSYVRTRSNPLPLVLLLGGMGGAVVGLVIFLFMQAQSMPVPAAGTETPETIVADGGGTTGSTGMSAAGTTSNNGGASGGGTTSGGAKPSGGTITRSPKHPSASGATTRPKTWRDELLSKFPAGTVLVDNVDANVIGNWASISMEGKMAGPDFLLADAAGGFVLQAVFPVIDDLADGDYELHVSYVPSEDRTRSVRLNVLMGETVVGTATIDQTKPPAPGGKHDGDSRFHYAGTYRLSGKAVRILLRNEGTAGLVAVDSILLVPLR